MYFEIRNFTDELIIVDVPSATARKIELDINKELLSYMINKILQRGYAHLTIKLFVT